MSVDELARMSAVELAIGYRRRTFSPVEVVQATLQRIDRLNAKLNAFYTLNAEEALKDARASQDAFMRGDPIRPLEGIPVSVKDTLPTKGLRTTFGSAIFEHNVPGEDVPSVEGLRLAGAAITGKTATPEFGYKASTETPLFGITRNPWDLTKTPGGSAGGAAAAAAACMGPLHLGTDGAGSIRIPSSFCGVYGLKPSHGVVPIYPAPAVGTLVQLGPIARSVRDAALMLQAIARRDDRDPYSLPGPHPDYLKACDSGVAGIRVAWSPTLGYARVVEEVAALTEKAAQQFRKLGCQVEQVDRVCDDPYGIVDVLFYAGYAERLGPFLDEYRSRMSPTFVPVLEQGRKVTGIEVMQAHTRRAAYYEAMRKVFLSYDLLLTPSLPVTAFAVASERPSSESGLLSWSAFTYPFNLTGQPAATVPCGFTRQGLPVGLQVVGRRLADPLVLAASAAFEAVQPWADKRPPLE